MGFDGSKFALSKQKKERKNEVTEKESHTLHLAIGAPRVSPLLEMCG